MIRLEEGNQRDELFQMWQRIFHDTTPYTTFYFNEIYGKNEILLEESDGNLRGMLHLNPYQMQMGDHKVNAHYIVGVSTEEEYRRQGVMRSLLDESFRSLRERGEAFTYLMPADEAYYLPFSFQFGMQQYEQEFEAGKLEPVEAGYQVKRITEIDLAEYANLENEMKKAQYAMATVVSEAYFERLYEEVRSEFGCFFFVEKEGKAIGRFVVYAEDDFLAISQMACYDTEKRGEFIQQIVQFCDQRYHFRHYRMTFPEDWKEELLESGQFGELHVFQTRRKPIIMFRILDLEKMGSFLRSKEDINCVLKIVDEDLKDQDGIYQFEASSQGIVITKLADDVDQVSDGSVDIAKLTARIFGNLTEEEKKMPENFNENARRLWTELEALAPIEIAEIV